MSRVTNSGGIDAVREFWAELVEKLSTLRYEVARLAGARRERRRPEPELNRAEAHLREALRGLQGARLGRVWLGAGELFVELEREGQTWTLGTGGSHWGLTRRDQVELDDSNDEEHLGRIDKVRGIKVIHAAPRIRDVAPGTAALQVSLERDWTFTIALSPEGVAADLPLFELRAPDNRYWLLFGDGCVSEVPGDVPVPKLIETGELHRWPSAV